ncbi:hypothetical protein [Nocardiopsis nanhaiensis]
MTTPETAQVPRSRLALLSPVMTGLSCLILFCGGLAVGMAASFGMGWFAHFWVLGLPVQAGIAAGVLAFLVLLYALCRLAGWGSRRQSGAAAFAAGFLVSLLGLIGYLPGGSIVFSDALINYVFLFGAMVALGAAVVRSAVFHQVRGPVFPTSVVPSTGGTSSGPSGTAGPG